MSISIPDKVLTQEIREEIANDLEFIPKTSKSHLPDFIDAPSATPIRPYLFFDDGLHIPFSYALSKGFRRKDRTLFPSISVPFEGKLRSLQKEVRKEVITLFNKHNCAILSLFCGGGKTITAINLATKIKLKTLVIVSRLVLLKQWKESIEKFCPTAKVQTLYAKSKIDPKADFYLMNAINVPKLGFESYKDIGFLISDEVHTIGTEKLSQSLLFVSPRYILGLSATPTRPDGMDSLLYAFFGEKKIFRKLYREHTVYKVPTGFVPEAKRNGFGKLDWNSVLTSQAECPERNKLIAKIVEHYKDRNFLILCKRVKHAAVLIGLLEDLSIDVTSLVGAKKHFDVSSRVLIATVQKAGVGFDHPRLDGLIIAADLQEYFIQYLGRVFRTQDSVPVIFDLVDKFGVLEAHYRTRRKVYIEHGGKVKKFIPPW